MVQPPQFNEYAENSVIGDMTPMEFMQHHQYRFQTAQESTSLALV